MNEIEAARYRAAQAMTEFQVSPSIAGALASLVATEDLARVINIGSALTAREQPAPATGGEAQGDYEAQRVRDFLGDPRVGVGGTALPETFGIDPKDARIAEPERERDEALERAESLKANWMIAGELRDKAEAALAEMRGKVEKARAMLRGIEHVSTTVGYALAILTEGTADEAGTSKGGDSDREAVASEGPHIAQPARDGDAPVPATHPHGGHMPPFPYQRDDHDQRWLDREAAIRGLVDALERLYAHLNDGMHFTATKIVEDALAAARDHGITGSAGNG